MALISQLASLEVLVNSIRLSRKSGITALVFVFGLTVAASAQFSVSDADIQRLQSDISDASSKVAQLRTRDPLAAAKLQGELDDASDEIIYPKVKLRKNETVTRSGYLDLRDRIDTIHVHARGELAPPATASAAARNDRQASTVGKTPSSTFDVPVGTLVDVRLQTALSSATAQVEDRFEATTLADYARDNRVLVPAGSVMRGVISSVKKAGRIERTGSVTLAF